MACEVPSSAAHERVAGLAQWIVVLHAKQTRGPSSVWGPVYTHELGGGGRMWAFLVFFGDVVRTLRASLGFARIIVGVVLCLLIFGFYEPAKSYLAQKGIEGLPDVPALWLALAFAGVFLIWNLLRYAIELQRRMRPVLSLKILDPGERYETYVALGNRLLRLYYVELENASHATSARRTTVSLECYRLAGDKRQVDIRSKLKVANSEAEEVDLKPRGRVAFELCGIEAIGDNAAAMAEARDVQSFSIVPAGSGTIRLLAEAENAPAIERRYMLYVDGRGTMTIKPQPAV